MFYKRKNKFIFIFFSIGILFISNQSNAQFYKKILNLKAEDTKKTLLSDNQIEYLNTKLRADMNYLSSQKLRERSTGSLGEKATGMFIQTRMQQNSLLPFQKTFRHSFKFVSGKVITPETKLKLNTQYVFVPEEAFPANFSAPTDLTDFVLPNVTEAFTPWLVPLYQSRQEADNPNFDWEQMVFERSKDAIRRKASAILFYDQYGAKNKPTYSKTSRFETLSIPIIILQKKAYDEHIKNMTTIQSFYANVKFRSEYQEGNNVIGYLNNNAAKTVVIATDYDRSDKHDDSGNHILNINELNNDASGIAALIALSKALGESTFIQYNYIFVALSGSNQGDIGIEYFLKILNEQPNKIAYAIHLKDLAGLDTKRQLFVYGSSSSNLFSRGFKSMDTLYRLKTEKLDDVKESHYAFDTLKIPALYFTTTVVDQSNTPSYITNFSGVMDVVKYVYSFIGTLNEPELARNSTSITNIGAQRNRNSITNNTTNTIQGTPIDLGIKIDDDYKGIGVLIKDVEKDAPAQKSKLLPGDILFQIGGNRVSNAAALKSVLLKFKKGDITKVKIKRGVTVQTFELVF